MVEMALVLLVLALASGAAIAMFAFNSGDSILASVGYGAVNSFAIVAVILGLAILVARSMNRQEKKVKEERRRLKVLLEEFHPGCRVSFLSGRRYLVTEKKTGKIVGEHALPPDLIVP